MATSAHLAVGRPCPGVPQGCCPECQVRFEPASLQSVSPAQAGDSLLRAHGLAASAHGLSQATRSSGHEPKRPAELTCTGPRGACGAGCRRVRSAGFLAARALELPHPTRPPHPGWLATSAHRRCTCPSPQPGPIAHGNGLLSRSVPVGNRTLHGDRSSGQPSPTGRGAHGSARGISPEHLSEAPLDVREPTGNPVGVDPKTCSAGPTTSVRPLGMAETAMRRLSTGAMR